MKSLKFLITYTIIRKLLKARFLISVYLVEKNTAQLNFHQKIQRNDL